MPEVEPILGVVFVSLLILVTCMVTFVILDVIHRRRVKCHWVDCNPGEPRPKGCLGVKSGDCCCPMCCTCGG